MAGAPSCGKMSTDILRSASTEPKITEIIITRIVIGRRRAKCTSHMTMDLLASLDARIAEMGRDHLRLHPRKPSRSTQQGARARHLSRPVPTGFEPPPPQ